MDAVTVPNPTDVVKFLAAEIDLSEPERQFLANMLRSPTVHAARSKLIDGSDGKCALILSGWAYGAVYLPSGRRQIIDFHLPGDAIGACFHASAKTRISYHALTQVVTVPAQELMIPRNAEFPGLSRIYETMAQQHEQRRVAQIVRLGRQHARERVASLILDLYERLERCGLTTNGAFMFPATQEILGDALGLSTVHVNRMLHDLRERKLLRPMQGMMQILDARGLARVAGGETVAET